MLINSHNQVQRIILINVKPIMGFIQATFTGVLLHGLRNVVYAAAFHSFEALGNRPGRIKMLAFGYAFVVLKFTGFILSPPNIVIYGLLFTVAGAYIVAEDALEGSVSGQMVGAMQVTWLWFTGRCEWGRRLNFQFCRWYLMERIRICCWFHFCSSCRDSLSSCYDKGK